MFKNLLKVLFFICLGIVVCDVSYGAGGSCTFSDNCPGTAFTFCSPVAAANSSCTTGTNCDASDDTETGPFSEIDECDLAWAAGGSSCAGSWPRTYTSSSGECRCTINGCMGALIDYTWEDPLCGSIENTSYTQICAPASYISTGSCLWTYSVSGISCSGGGASLQWVIYPSAATCANLVTNYPNASGALYCTGGSLSNWNATQDLTPGVCYLMMFDGNAKAACNWTFNIVPPTPTVSVTDNDADNAVCIGGCVTLTAGGDCYTSRVWTNNAGQPGGTASTYTICFPSAGTYTVTLTNTVTAGACAGAAYSASTTQTYTVTACCVAPTISLVTQTNVLCNGAATGALDINVVGGTAPYTYAWSNSGSTQDITGLVAGAYTVTVTEALLCTATATWTITQNPLLVITPTLVTNVLCPCESTGAIDITVTGGVPGYTYAWSNGASTEDLTGIPGGVSYTVTVTDTKACTKTYSTAITVPAAIAIALVSSVNPSCNGVCNGSATYQASGGTSPYDYSNNGGAAYQFNNQAGNVTYPGLCAGAITITVRDANNCVTPP